MTMILYARLQGGSSYGRSSGSALSCVLEEGFFIFFVCILSKSIVLVSPGLPTIALKSQSKPTDAKAW